MLITIQNSKSKFQFSQPNFITSFTIIVSADIFPKLLNLNFCLANTLSSKYDYKERSSAANFGVLSQREFKKLSIIYLTNGR